MTIKSFISTLFLVLSTAFSLSAQEIFATISVNAPALQTVDPVIFQSLRNDLTEFMNNTSWTGNEYSNEERLQITMTLNISEETSPTSFEAELVVQSTRPVYGSTYTTPIFTYLDGNISFTYQQFQPIEFTENIYNDPLSSIFAYYAYVIIGMDKDTFSPFGGEPHFQEAQNIYNTLPQAVQAGDKGWSPSKSNRNRFWLIENLLTPRMRPFRQSLYDYHRQGLDIMHSEPDVGRAVIASAIMECGKANETYPNSMILQLYSQGKSDEILNIFANGTRKEKDKVSQVMIKIDPTNSTAYRRLNF